MRNLPAVLLLWLLCAASMAPAGEQSRSTTDRGGAKANESFNLDVPPHAYDLILCRPENHSITLSVLAYQDGECYLTADLPKGPTATETQTVKKGVPLEIALNWLFPDNSYDYQFHWRPSGAKDFQPSPKYTFHAARAAGREFTFTLTADAHLDGHTSSAVYEQTLRNIAADHGDFHIDLGNLFMTDKHATRQEALAAYIAQRYYLGQIGCTTPVLLALGTHDGEAGRYDDGTADCLAVWSNLTRKKYFPNPTSDRFYSGNDTEAPHRGLPQNYYAFEWGDALFVVLDPFTNSSSQHGNADGWGWSLGRSQYDWLAKTLAHSHAKLKFVFIHNLLRGDQASRGGIEFAAFNEWGGKNPDGSDGFAAHRPGWDRPVHQLLVQNHVSAVFRAHDNFYARQELDGTVYLMVPQPSFAGNDRIRDLDAYGYKQGTFLGNSGHVRVSVKPTQATIEYIRSIPPDSLLPGHNADVADKCAINAR